MGIVRYDVETMFSSKLVAWVTCSRITQHLASPLHLLSSSSPIHSCSASQQHSNANNIRLNHKDWLAPNEVLKIFDNLKDPSSVLAVLDQYSKRKDYKPTEALYTLIINKLAQAKKFDDVEEVLKKIKLEKSCRLSEEFFYNVIKVYGNMACRINRAIETLYDMPKNGYWPSVKTFNFVLNLLVSSKLFDAVHEIYESAAKLGIEIDACCLNILIKGLCESGNLEAALYVLDEFPKQKCSPSVRTFSPLMRSLCDNGKLDEAFGLLNRMEKEGVDPDTICFNILLSGLRKQGRVEEGMVLLEEMKMKGCEPNPGSYQEILYGLLDKERFSEAKQLMGRMISSGATPSFVSYKKLIQGFCEENLVVDADWVLKQMVKQGFVPKMGIWKQVVLSVLLGSRASDYATFDQIVNQ